MLSMTGGAKYIGVKNDEYTCAIDAKAFASAWKAMQGTVPIKIGTIRSEAQSLAENVKSIRARQKHWRRVLMYQSLLFYEIVQQRFNGVAS